MTPGPPAPRWHRHAASLAAAALLAAGAASMLHVSARSSPVWDEVNAFGLGAWYLETGRFDLPGACQPPLAAYLAALPLDTRRALATGAFDPLRPDAPAAARLDNDVERGNLLLQRLGLEQLLRTRWPSIAVYLLLGVRPAWYENPLLEGPSQAPLPRRGWLFVSSTNLGGLFLPGDPYRWLRQVEPDAVVGGTIYGFDLDRLGAGRPAGAR